MNTVRLKTVLKTFFKVGSRPTESDFSDLITSMVANTPNVTGGDSAEAVNVAAGNASGTGNAGNVLIRSGQASGTGSHGTAQILHPSGASIIISANGRINITSPVGISITNSTTGDSVSY